MFSNSNWAVTKTCPLCVFNLVLVFDFAFFIWLFKIISLLFTTQTHIEVYPSILYSKYQKQATYKVPQQPMPLFYTHEEHSPSLHKVKTFLESSFES